VIQFFSLYNLATHMGKLFVSKECNGTAFVVERPVYIN
jgi:hypothetical protein